MEKPNDARESVFTPTPDGVSLRIKVVPGASRTKIVGLLENRLKVAVAAPAEGGKANQAVSRLLSRWFDIPEKNVLLTAGLTNPKKTVELIGLSIDQAVERLTTILDPID